MNNASGTSIELCIFFRFPQFSQQANAGLRERMKLTEEKILELQAFDIDCELFVLVRKPSLIRERERERETVEEEESFWYRKGFKK